MAVLIAFLIDFAGEPKNRWHPVAWMGQLIVRLRALTPQGGDWVQLGYGGAVTAGGATAIYGMSAIFLRLFSVLPQPIPLLCEAWLLKTAFSRQRLADVGEEVSIALEYHDLPEARQLVGWNLVSRETDALSQEALVAATIESVAENTSDSIVAPLLYYAVGGVPAALAYRWINTLDAMWGYRDEAREWLGKVPARTDDLLNLLPSRITAVIFTIFAPFSGGDAAHAQRIWLRDAHQTDSPNAGHPMSAMAGALNVELIKTGQYRLGAGQLPPKIGDIRRAVRLMNATAVLVTIFVWLLRSNQNSHKKEA